MATFKIFERVDAIRIYTVEALNEDEAREIVNEGYAEWDEEDFIDFEIFKVEYK